MKPLEAYLKPTQIQLFKKLSAQYRGQTVVRKGKYILVRGEAPVMLLAHLDTVHKEPVKDICKTRNGNILMSPQGIGGDDRCGVYAISTAYEQSDVKPWLLFTCDEEVGCIGADAFCDDHQKKKLPKELELLKFLIEIDRKGKNDAVYYDCDSEDFEEYITSKGFETEWGSCSDISSIAPELGVAAVNLSSGYYNAHTLHEYINRKELNRTVKRVVDIVADAVKPDCPKYEYVEALRVGRRSLYYGYEWGVWPAAKSSKPVAESTVPKSIADEYDALLDFYTTDELDKFREEHGDDIILMLFESEFGGSYKDIYGMGDENDDK